jgi:hypothetical protein
LKNGNESELAATEDRKNKRRCTYNETLRRLHETIVRFSRFSVYVCVNVRARVYAREKGRLRACAWVWVWVHGRWRVLARVALVIQHATPRHFVICGPSGSTVFFDIIS